LNFNRTSCCSSITCTFKIEHIWVLFRTFSLSDNPWRKVSRYYCNSIGINTSCYSREINLLLLAITQGRKSSNLLIPFKLRDNNSSWNLNLNFLWQIFRIRWSILNFNGYISSRHWCGWPLSCSIRRTNLNIFF